MSLSIIQKTFSESILTPNGDIQPELASAFKQYSPDELSARLSIYRNNTYTSLVAALSETFTNIVHTVGEEFFSVLAKEFIQESPPKTASLIQYGDSFPKFIQQHERIQQLPYLSDLAKLDFARNMAYYAEEKPSLTQTDYAALSPEQLINSVVTPNSSVVLLRSPYAIYSIHRFNENGGHSETSYTTPEFGVTSRTEAGITSHQLTQPFYDFFDYLTKEATVGEALENVLKQTPDFNASNAIQFLIQSEFGTQLTFPKQ